jgi:hypothetical protein
MKHGDTDDTHLEGKLAQVLRETKDLSKLKHYLTMQSNILYASFAIHQASLTTYSLHTSGLSCVNT